MKKIFFLILWMLAAYAMAQDVIVKKDGSTILSKVLEITQTELKYKKFNHPNGPTYTVFISDLQAVNYENGEKVNFDGKARINQPMNSANQDNSSLQNISYEQLAGMVAIKTASEKKIKRLKTWGWIGGGVFAAAGVVLTAIGAPDIAGSDTPNYDEGLLLMITGLSLVGIGTAWTTAFLVRARNLEMRQGPTVSAAPLFQYDFQLNNGMTLTAGVDMLRDSRFNNRTLGLGLRYNF